MVAAGTAMVIWAATAGITPPGRILRNLSSRFLEVIVTQRLSWNISASLGHFHRGAGSRQAAE